MIRVLAEGLVLFLLPFGLFAAVLVLTRRRVLHPESWSKSGVWLAIAGLVLVAGSFVYGGIWGETHTGAFEPTHVENGRVVPGRFH